MKKPLTMVVFITIVFFGSVGVHDTCTWLSQFLPRLISVRDFFTAAFFLVVIGFVDLVRKDRSF